MPASSDDSGQEVLARKQQGYIAGGRFGCTRDCSCTRFDARLRWASILDWSAAISFAQLARPTLAHRAAAPSANVENAASVLLTIAASAVSTLVNLRAVSAATALARATVVASGILSRARVSPSFAGRATSFATSSISARRMAAPVRCQVLDQDAFTRCLHTRSFSMGAPTRRTTQAHSLPRSLAVAVLAAI